MLTVATKNLITVAEHRAVGLLHKALSQSPDTCSQYGHILETSDSEAEFYAAAGPILLAAIKNSKFPAQFARTLPGPFNEIITADMVRGLERSTKLGFSNFGTFVRDVVTRKLRISFEFDLVLDTLAVRKSGVWREKFHDVADDICIQNVSILGQLPDLRSFGTSRPSSSEAIQYRAADFAEMMLAPILRSFVNHPLVVKAMRSAPRAKRKGLFGPGTNWFALVSIPSAFTAYYSWILAVAYELRSSSELTMEGIGRFQITGTDVTGHHQVSFEPDNKLLKLLEANFPPEGSLAGGSADSFRNVKKRSHTAKKAA